MKKLKKDKATAENEVGREMIKEWVLLSYRECLEMV